MNIKSMIPAVGWAAVYENDNSSVAKPLVGWVVHNLTNDRIGDEGHVVVAEIKTDCIVGLVVDDEGHVVVAETLEGFKTYEYDLDSASIDYLAVKNGN